MTLSILTRAIRKILGRPLLLLGLLAALPLTGMAGACTPRPAAQAVPPQASQAQSAQEEPPPPDPEPSPLPPEPYPESLPATAPPDDSSTISSSEDARDLHPRRSTRPATPALIDKSLRFVRLFYGTNRARTEHCAQVAEARWDGRERCRPAGYYDGLPASGRGETKGLEVGTMAVTFPPGHSVGKIERPLQIFTLSFRDEDPDRDVVISELRSFGSDHEAWALELRATGRDQAFIYVHGFQTSFDQAARRAAQLAYDLDFDLEEDFRGVPMFFSWPSRGGVDAYGLDYDTSAESVDAFNRFLDLVKKRANIRRVHIIAHSMGNRVVAEALDARAQPNPQLVDQLILAAPDVSASSFKSRLLHILPKLASRVTLYVSDHDQALLVSRRIRKGEPRAGEVAGGLLEASRGVEGFDAINASTLESDLLGHSYYANHGSMLGDIYCLLKGFPANSRPLLMVAGAAWQFRPPAELAKLQAGACRAAVPPLPVLDPEQWSSLWLPMGIGLMGAMLLSAGVMWFRRGRAS